MAQMSVDRNVLSQANNLTRGTADFTNSTTKSPQDAIGNSSERSTPAVVLSLSSAITSAGTGIAAPKSFATVANDARGALDNAYAAAGRVYDGKTVASDWDKAFSGMDRRSLFAVASNEGGQFSERESAVAKFYMAQQQSAAFNPPGSLGPTAAGYKAGIQFLDSVSAEEKASFEWATQRAVTESTYEFLARREGEDPEDLSSADPVVQMIKAAMDALQGTTDTSVKLEDTAAFKQAETLSKARSETASSRLIDRMA